MGENAPPARSDQITDLKIEEDGSDRLSLSRYRWAESVIRKQNENPILLENLLSMENSNNVFFCASCWVLHKKCFSSIQSFVVAQLHLIYSL